ncbi:MAG: aspartate-semialdehyde dehydrogenase [Candidatus Sumerlaeia bacterium]|nr:aspartate-semialdehyde dehydrogenase [Candidatus Sumerlaeia bacterium]
MINVAILGASGAVGQEMMKILEQRQFPLGKLKLLTSPRSAGRKFPFRGRLIEAEAVNEKSFDDVQIALFSAGGSISEKWAPIATKAGAIVVDNTSAFRMDADVPLVVPEVNGDLLDKKPARGIIANPNCSTIQMVQVLDPLHKKYKIKRLVIATYQSVSGKGLSAIDEMMEQSQMILEGETDDLPIEEFPHQIAFNILPHIDVFTDNGYTKEEMKMVNETRKILRDDSIRVTPTCVRVPVIRAHSEAINIEFEKKASAEDVRALLAKAENVVVVDDPAKNDYPLAIYAEGRDETFVGRIRNDISNPDGTGIDLWIVSDNLRKGAALNAVQIAEALLRKGTVK